MAAFSFAELVLNDHLTNISNYNPTTVTNRSLTSLSSVKVGGHKRKRSSLPDILSTTAGRAKKFLKRFSPSFVTSSDDGSYSPNKIGPNNNSISPLGEHGKNRFQLSPSNEKIGFEKMDTSDAFGRGALLASRSPKAVCFDSVSSTKWSHVEISMSPKKCEQSPSVGLLPRQHSDVCECLQHCDVSSSHARASRMLRWDQSTTGNDIKKELPNWSSSVCSHQVVDKQRMPYLNRTRQVTASESELCMSLNNGGTTNHAPNIPPKANNVGNKHVLRRHLQTGSSRTIKKYEPSRVEYKHLSSAGNPLFIKDAYTETSVLKALLNESGFFNENIDETKVQPTEGAPQASQEKNKYNMQAEIDDSKVTESLMVNRGLKCTIKTKSTKSLLFLPFPNVPFKIKAIQPICARFDVSYTESSMIPTVKTAGEVFEAKLQEITIDSLGREGFRNSPSDFCCTITVEASDSAAKFEEIKNALRVVCDAYNIESRGVMETLPKISGKRRKTGHSEEATMVKYPGHNTASGTASAVESSEVLTEPYNLQASSIDCDIAPSSIDNIESVSAEQIVASDKQDGLAEQITSKEGEAVVSLGSQEACGPVRRSRRKIKTVPAWKKMNAYATSPTWPHPMSNLVTYPVNFDDDRKYLERTMIVNQFIQDITGVPVVVLERLSSQELQEKLSRPTSSST